MTKPPDVLTAIVEHKRLEVATAKSAVPSAEIDELIASQSPPRGFQQRLFQHIAAGRSGIIAECKKASPSKGTIRPDYDVAEIARSYQAGGASCLSVLTDSKFFQGSVDHLITARKVCDLPVLRKDFMIDTYQIRESRAIGADCILLIVAVLELAQLIEFSSEAADLGLDVLVEVHSEDELEIALQLKQGMLGINNRNLRTFETTLDTSIDLSRRVPANRLIISESGIHSAADVEMLKSAGIDAFLIGESFMRAQNPGHELSEIFGAKQFARQTGKVA